CRYLMCYGLTGGESSKMIPILALFVIFAEGVTSSLLDSIDVYDNNSKTKFYLYLGCDYLTHKEIKKYESETIREKLRHAYYNSCINLVWPESEGCFLPTTYKCPFGFFDTFKKGDTLG